MRTVLEGVLENFNEAEANAPRIALAAADRWHAELALQ